MDRTEKAWRDPSFRAGLSAQERQSLPDHPCGEEATNVVEINRSLNGISLGQACMITFGGGCGTAGCSRVVCSESLCSNPCSEDCSSTPGNTRGPICCGPTDKAATSPDQEGAKHFEIVW